MENYNPNLKNPMILPKKFDEFSTSTPQRRLTNKLSVLPMKFESSYTTWENSLSFLRTTETAVYDSHVITMTIPRPSIELTHAEEAMLQLTANKSLMVKRNGKKMSNNNNRRRRMSVIGGQYKRPATNKQQFNKRREQRNNAFSQRRKLNDEEHVKQTIVSNANNNATFLIDGEPENESSLIDESYIERCEINAFHNEIDRLQVNGSTSLNNIENEILIHESDENTNFELLCNTKASEHPYNDTDLKMTSMDLHEKNDTNAGESIEERSENEENNNALPISTNSSLNTTSTTAKANSHCTHPMYLNQHKIPQIVRHKSLARISLNTEENASGQSKFIKEFLNLHPFIKCYLVAITVAFVAVLVLSLIN